MTAKCALLLVAMGLLCVLMTTTTAQQKTTKMVTRPVTKPLAGPTTRKTPPPPITTTKRPITTRRVITTTPTTVRPPTTEATTTTTTTTVRPSTSKATIATTTTTVRPMTTSKKLEVSTIRATTPLSTRPQSSRASASTSRTNAITSGSSKAISSTRSFSSTRPSSSTPRPAENLFYVADATGNICIILQFNAIFKITYTAWLTGQLKTINIPFNARGAAVDGACGSSRQSITLNWRPSTVSSFTSPWSLTFFLTTVGSSIFADSYTVEKVSAQYLLDRSTFPDLDPADVGKWVTVSIATSSMESRFKTPIGGVFRCNMEEKIVVDRKNLELDTNQFKIEAFRRSRTAEFSRKETVCSEDKGIPMSPVAAVVIGVVLLVMVAIAAAVGGIFICKRRQNNGYQNFS